MTGDAPASQSSNPSWGRVPPGLAVIAHGRPADSAPIRSPRPCAGSRPWRTRWLVGAAERAPSNRACCWHGPGATLLVIPVWFHGGGAVTPSLAVRQVLVCLLGTLTVATLAA